MLSQRGRRGKLQVFPNILVSKENELGRGFEPLGPRYKRAIILLESYTWKRHDSPPRARSCCPRTYALPAPGDRGPGSRSKKHAMEFCFVRRAAFPKRIWKKSPAACSPNASRKL